MEFLRFGSSIPGTYWGCCACCIIQNLNYDPDTKASIQIVEGDGGTPYNPNKFAGMTYREIFEQRLRYGTFSSDPASATNHAFIVILSRSQTDSTIGKAWLAILKQHGFEFVRTVNNSVWNKDNYIFMLVRNVGSNAVKDQFKPPKAWTDLEGVVVEPYQLLGDTVELTATIKAKQKELYDALPPLKFYTEKELDDFMVPVSYAGKRSHQHGAFAVGFPQQTREQRQKFQAAYDALVKPAEPKPSAFPAKAAPPPVAG
jgi:hypothetical protein